MKKMTILEAAEQIGVSKEAIHNRIRRGSLECVVENGIKYVVVDEQKTAAPKRSGAIRTTNSANEKYNKLLEEQNIKLHDKVDNLESEVRELRDQIEKMLVAEKKKIEEVYVQKDEQLKSILSAISSKTMLTPPTAKSEVALDEVEQIAVGDDDILDVDHNDEDENHILLKQYLKENKVSKKRKAKIKKVAKKDNKIFKIDGKYCIDPSRYDYSYLLKI